MVAAQLQALHALLREVLIAHGIESPTAQMGAQAVHHDFERAERSGPLVVLLNGFYSALRSSSDGHDLGHAHAGLRLEGARVKSAPCSPLRAQVRPGPLRP
jgi:hypothetical protein